MKEKSKKEILKEMEQHAVHIDNEYWGGKYWMNEKIERIYLRLLICLDFCRYHKGRIEQKFADNLNDFYMYEDIILEYGKEVRKEKGYINLDDLLNI